MTKTVYPPIYVEKDNNTHIFLAGSIEMGLASDWQKYVIDQFNIGWHVTFMNPRRKEWDNTWGNTLADKNFKIQVTWELDHLLEKADIPFFYFDPKTKAPVSLMELGLVCASKKFKDIVIVCPPAYWRYGNVQAVAERYKFAIHHKLDDGILHLRSLILQQTEYA